MKTWMKLLIAGFVCVILGVAAGLVGALAIFSNSGKFCTRVSVAGISLSGLTQQDATERMQSWVQNRTHEPFTIKVFDRKWQGTVGDFGTTFSWKKALETAFRIGRNDKMLQRMVKLLGLDGDTNIVPEMVMASNSVRSTVQKIAKTLDRPHKDAYITLTTGRPEVVPEKLGIKLNCEEAALAIETAVRSGARSVELHVEEDKPKLTADSLGDIDSVLASYTTSFPNKRDRTHNLKLASQAINGFLLMPGKEFSYNNTVGERAENRGFRNAIIFINGQMEEGLGGGVCQVSSTLYNVVLLAGMNVTERHHHSRTVAYVRPGRDATVSYGSRDFRFTNDGSSPIYIYAQVVGNRLRMAIYGSAADKKQVKVYTAGTTYTPISGVKTVMDPEVAPGKKKVVDKGSRGASTVVYRKLTGIDGIERVEVVSRDRYPMQKVIVAIGPSRLTESTGGGGVIPASAETPQEISTESTTD